MAKWFTLEATDRALLIRLGDLNGAGVRRRHRQGYRYDEVATIPLTEWSVGSSHRSLESMGLVSSFRKVRYLSGGRKEPVNLIDLTRDGLAQYFIQKEDGTRTGLQPKDLMYLDKVLSNESIIMSELSASVLLKYIDFIDISQQTGYDVSEFGRRVLEEEDKVKARELYQGLEDAVAIAPRTGLANFQVEAYFAAVKAVGDETNRPKPRVNILRARLNILLNIVQVIGVAAAVISAVIAFLQYLGS